MDLPTLKTIAEAMVAPGKGILAIDESSGTCKKRFEVLGVECNEENRRLYRQLLVTAQGIEKYISGYILYDETLRQKTDEGISFAKVLQGKGIMPGIKVDTGPKDLALHPGEKITEGLDGLRERLAEYKTLGAQFAKWRAVITIGPSLPTLACIHANAHALARYAALVQEAGLVPIVEPEIMIEGNHTIERCYDVSAQTWEALFRELRGQKVALEGTILKTSMVLSGKEAKILADQATVAKMTLKGLKENVPKELAGIVFLSGGQSDEDSTIHLNLINQLKEKKPWPISFSYGRGIQRPALEIWAKNKNAIQEAQKALTHRAHMNSLAAQGKWTPEAENL